MSRPNLENLAYLLGVYSNSTIPQTYLNEMSNYELLLTVINKVNEIIERLGKYDEAINEVINYLNTLDDKVLKQVEDYLNILKDNGYITDKIAQIINSKKILMIGDSYLAGAGLPDPNIQGFGALVKSSGFDVTALASSGGGFTANGINGTFNDLLNSYTGERSAITDILILGGVNDSYTQIDGGLLATNITTTIMNAHKLYPNAKIAVGYISQLHRDNTNIYKSLLAKETYKTGSVNSRYAYITNSENMLKRVGLLQPDGVHPTVEGHRYLAAGIISYLINGNISTQGTLKSVKLNPSPQVPNPDADFYMLQDNNVIQLSSHQSTVYRCATGEATPKFELNGNNVLQLGTFQQSLIWGQSESATEFSNCMWTVPATITLWTDSTFTSSKTYAIPLTMVIVSETLVARPMLVDDVGGNFFNAYIKQINIAPWSTTIDANLC